MSAHILIRSDHPGTCLENLFTVTDKASPAAILTQVGCLVQTAQCESRRMAERLKLGGAYSAPYLLEMAEALLDSIEVKEC